MEPSQELAPLAPRSGWSQVRLGQGAPVAIADGYQPSRHTEKSDTAASGTHRQERPDVATSRGGAKKISSARASSSVLKSSVKRRDSSLSAAPFSPARTTCVNRPSFSRSSDGCRPLVARKRTRPGGGVGMENSFSFVQYSAFADRGVRCCHR